MRFIFLQRLSVAKNVHCSDENHIDAINSDIVNSLIQPGEQIMQNNKKKYTHNLDGLSMLIICMIHLEKLDKSGLMLATQTGTYTRPACEM